MGAVRALLLASLLLAEPAADEPAPGVSTPVLSLWIAGGVGLAVGVSFGIKALVHQSRATDIDYIGGQHEVAKTHTSQLIANLGYGVGLASLAAGLIWQRMFPDLEATLVPTSDSVDLVVRF